jgi:hypothetical protein
LLLSKPDILAYLHEGKLRFDPAITEERVAQALERVYIPPDLPGFRGSRSTHELAF